MFSAPVRDVMTTPVIVCSPELPLADAYRQLTEHDISSMAVVTEGRLTGVVSRADLLPFAVQAGRPGSFPDRAVDSVMTAPAVTVPEGASLREAAALMVERRIHRVFVADGERAVGVVSTRDVMHVIANTPCDVAISELATVPVHAVDVAAPISEAVSQLEELRVTALIVCEDEQPIGLLTQRGALAARDRGGQAPVEDAMDAAVICLHETASVHRAARLARRMGARRIVTTWHRSLHGVLSGMDFARFVAEYERP